MASCDGLFARIFIVISLSAIAAASADLSSSESAVRKRSSPFVKESPAAASSGRKRRHPSPSPSAYYDERKEVFAGRAVILKLGRVEFLQDMVAKGEGLDGKLHDDPVEFFPSLDGKPR